MKVVINNCYGGFSVSKAVYDFLGLPVDSYGYCKYTGECWDRNDPDLVRAVEALGEKANGRNAELAIVDIPDDVKWHVVEYDGIECVAEDHRVWMARLT